MRLHGIDFGMFTLPTGAGFLPFIICYCSLWEHASGIIWSIEWDKTHQYNIYIYIHIIYNGCSFLGHEENNLDYPLVHVYITMENHHAISG